MAGRIATAVEASKAEPLAVTQKKTMMQVIKSMEGEFKKALPSVITPERFTRMALTTISANPDIAACTPQSFAGALLQAAQLGLEPNTVLGQCYLIPYNNNVRGIDGSWQKIKQVQFQVGYKGMIDLAYRSGEIESIQAHCVYENDKFEYAYGLEPKLEHIPAMSDRGRVIGAYAVFKTKSGGFGFEVMSVDDITSHAQKFSKCFDNKNTPWQTNFEEMCKKTVLKKALKYAPLKSDFVKGVAADETVKSEISEDMFTVQDESIIDAEVSEVSNETAEPVQQNS